jgi:histidinol phosphatase-like enzyme (inositol monophosphatase family)
MQEPPAIPPQALADLSAFAQSLADLARPLSRQWFRRPLQIDQKADDSPVTRADREVEAALREAIARRYPEHGIYGEEYGASAADSEYTWVIDPIDGTRSFISGFPLWGTLLALLRHGRPVLGIIDMPIMDERWTGVAGQPARLGARPCRVSQCADPAQAILYATSPDIFENKEVALFERLASAVHMRRYGGDCYSYGLLASGHVDLVVESGLQPYDYLAIAPVVQGAGGVITDWEGQALSLRSAGRVVAAATPELHRKALHILSS